MKSFIKWLSEANIVAPLPILSSLLEKINSKCGNNYANLPQNFAKLDQVVKFFNLTKEEYRELMRYNIYQNIRGDFELCTDCIKILENIIQKATASNTTQNNTNMNVQQSNPQQNNANIKAQPDKWYD